ncbi:MAG: hypothetical protein ACRCYR_19125 [Phycicoccus sp.]
MNRTSIVSIGVTLTLGVGGGTAYATGRAATSTPPAATQQAPDDDHLATHRQLAGTVWRVEIPAGPDTVLPNVLTFHRDGMVTLSQPGIVASVVPGGSDLVYNGSGQGYWTAQRDGVRFTALILSAAEDGSFEGEDLVEGTARLGNDGTLDIEARLNITTPSGAPGGTTSVSGTGRPVPRP